jgi:hypothetical protein
MKTFSHCPVCKDPMRNEPCSKRIDGGAERWRIVCDKHLDHDILALTIVGHDDLLLHLQIAVYMNTIIWNRIYANWNFEKKELTIDKGRGMLRHNVIIPYFEPDLTQYDKLLKKMRVYLTFS